MARNTLNYQPPTGQWGGDAYAMPVSEAPAETRASFIKKTYLHLVGAILALVAVDALIFAVVPASTLQGLVGGMVNGYMWLLVLGLFMVVSWVARSWATNATSQPMQYAGLGLYVVAQAIIFVPLLYIAQFFGGAGIIGTAAIVTLLMVAALTAFVFITGADFSFMRGFLMIAGFGALGLIGASVIFGFTLGIIFTVAMIVLLCGYILYDTSNILHHYLPGQHVAASLALFASVATLFWYVLQLLMSLQRE